MITFIVATRNRHKVEEIKTLLGAGFEVITLDRFSGAPSVVEDAPTFAGNASKKARESATWLGVHHPELIARGAWVLADDSGLEVDVLNGAPGVHSARFAALDRAVSGNTPDQANNAKLLELLKSVPMERRTARFRCVLAVVPVIERAVACSSAPCMAEESELETQVFQGACEGRIAFEPRGTNGFGYDPLFVPDGFTQSFAELGEEVKNRLSHRARAFVALKSGFVS